MVHLGNRVGASFLKMFVVLNISSMFVEYHVEFLGLAGNLVSFSLSAVMSRLVPYWINY